MVGEGSSAQEDFSFMHTLSSKSSTVTFWGASNYGVTSRYAALCGSGVWKGKRNKRLVATARVEWEATAALKRHSGVGFWLKHVKGHSGHKWNDAADGLATRGLDGERCRVYLPRLVD